MTAPPGRLAEARGPRAAATLRGVVEAAQAAREAQARLRAAVAGAREDGRTWAEVGAALGITRQAAFKRFGGPRDPRTGETMTSTPTDDLVALTEQVFTRLDAGDYEVCAR